ncbi:MAG: methyltransferase domain-containing protein [bacterium]|nr:methyltransferase domain-containing protein [bacterium]
MKYKLLNILFCPGCLSKLNLISEEAMEDEIIKGTLRCPSCNYDFLIREGVVILGLRNNLEIKEKLAEMEGEYKWVYENHNQEEHLEYLRNYAPIMNKGIRDIMKQRKGALLLDLGAGCCETSWMFTKYGAEVVSIDIMPEFIRCGGAFIDQNHYFERLVGDVEILPFANDSFDIVFCKEILHHVSDFKAVISEINRILKPKGICVIWEPVKGILRQKDTEQEKSGLIHHEYSFFYYRQGFKKCFNLKQWKPLLEQVKIKNLIYLPKYLISLYTILIGGGVSFELLTKDKRKKVTRGNTEIVPINLERFHVNDSLVKKEKQTKMPKELDILQSLT